MFQEVLTLRLQTVQIRNLASIEFYYIFNQVVSYCSHPFQLSHDALPETNVTTSPHHVFVAHRNLRNLSLPANGKWVF